MTEDEIAAIEARNEPDRADANHFLADCFSDNAILIAEVRRLRSLVERLAPAEGRCHWCYEGSMKLVSDVPSNSGCDCLFRNGVRISTRPCITGRHE